MKFIIEVSATTGTDILSQITSSSLLHISTIARRLSKQKITNFLLQSSLRFHFQLYFFFLVVQFVVSGLQCSFHLSRYTLSKICSVVKKIQQKTKTSSWRRLTTFRCFALFASSSVQIDSLVRFARLGRKRKKAFPQ